MCVSMYTRICVDIWGLKKMANKDRREKRPFGGIREFRLFDLELVVGEVVGAYCSIQDGVRESLRPEGVEGNKGKSG